ncbi:MAG TPA: hypothetical protein VFX89_18735 [Gammaproteobacteria bacterium]|nr:hypothetical protein [Gammaproteobacteria bacterium]
MRLRIVCICVGLATSGMSWAAKTHPGGEHASAFATSADCIACHSGVRDAAGEDVSIAPAWRATIMANSARDPYWQAAVRRETLDHPEASAEIQDTCSTCHMPMARFDAALAGRKGEVFANLPPDAPSHVEAFDGVSCSVCHQINPVNLGTPESYDGGFKIDTSAAFGTRPMFGPYAIEQGRAALMRSSAQFTPSTGPHVQQSTLCATCHTLYTRSVGGAEGGDLPEQVPYEEWLHSDYRDTRSCQSCHMPEVPGSVPISSVLGEPREHVSRHTFRGGNAFMLGLLNKYRDELGVRAPSAELDEAVRDTHRYLATSAATVAIESAQRRGNSLAVDVAVASITGHKLPTGYPARRAWLHLTVRDANGAVLFESGRVQPDGSIMGNDNDVNPDAFERHYEEIGTQDQVQIYESIMADAAGKPTTALLRGVTYAKDNRLLPRGFDKTTAPAQVAVLGDAARDVDFAGGGDRVRYRIALAGRAAGALRVDVELLYQPIGYRWAKNLEAYDAFETRRFTGYYADTIGSAPAAQLAEAHAVVP